MKTTLKFTLRPNPNDSCNETIDWCQQTTRGQQLILASGHVDALHGTPAHARLLAGLPVVVEVVVLSDPLPQDAAS